MMTKNENNNMADMGIAERLKSAILNKGTYEEMSEMTGISVSTLVRISSGKTEPKLSDIIKISNVTERSMDWICYGEAMDQKQHADDTFVAAADGTDYETNEAHRYVIWNLRTLDKQDIQSIAKQVKALSSYRFTFRQQAKELAVASLIRAIANEEKEKFEKVKEELIKDFGTTNEEIESIIKKAKT